ncbi:MAG: DUF2911 domain-containing protein [Bacteroidetes bacterium]|nr:MAG: DUF2911 domain-containing protein [Bacteroidota bacterium]
MINRISLNVFLLLLLGAMISPLNAQIRTPAPSPLATVIQAVGLSEIKLEYSRPSARGRKVFGELVPYGKVWRTGANASTKITFGTDVTFGGEAVKSGTYALYSIPGEKEWTFMLYSDLTLGGNVAGYDEANEIVRVTAKSSALNHEVETFTLGFDHLRDESAHLVLSWAKTRVAVPITWDTDGAVMANIERVMGGPTAGDYYQAAVYYYNTDRDLDKALTWINKALEGGERYWIVTWKARILGKMGHKAEAIATAERAKKLAEEGNNPDYVKINEDLIAGWK